MKPLVPLSPKGTRCALAEPALCAYAKFTHSRIQNSKSLKYKVSDYFEWLVYLRHAVLVEMISIVNFLIFLICIKF
ncbi:hypothetical protein NIES4073_08970 [Kalymmatonema gypsitolerans NIES-4073]|nr:hypothetical protein NIES4073_08970 [Scytonema sp. NIES-4073]